MISPLLVSSGTGDLQGLEQPGWEELHHSEYDREHGLCEWGAGSHRGAAGVLCWGTREGAVLTIAF
jgi:hypothetical protein